jgi:hypothetical protein
LPALAHGRKEDLGDDLARLENAFLFVIDFGEDIELLERHTALSTSTYDFDRAAQGYERRGGVRRVNDEAGASAEDAVVVVLTVHGIALIATLLAAVEITTEVPATRSLTEISTQGPLVSELRACDLAGGLSQSGVALTDPIVFRHLGDGRHGSDAETSVGRLSNPSEILDVAEAHELFGIEDTVA